MRSGLSLSVFGLLVGGCLVVGASAESSGKRLAACSEDQVPMSTTAAFTSGKNVTGVVAAWTWGTSPCLLNARLTFTVKRFTLRISPGGAIRTISGNPGIAPVRVVLRPGAVFAASWRWRNWCGRRGSFQLQPSFSDWPYVAVPSRALRAPACGSRTTRSTLARVPVRLRRCAAGDLRLDSGIRGGFMQSLIAGAWVTLRPQHGACLLTRAKVAFAIQERVGGSWKTQQRIVGNPGQRVIGALLPRSGEIAVAYWAWRNWCGDTGTFRTLAHVDGRTVAGAVFTETPSCQDSSFRSTLTPSFAHS